LRKIKGVSTSKKIKRNVEGTPKKKGCTYLARGASWASF